MSVKFASAVKLPYFYNSHLVYVLNYGRPAIFFFPVSFFPRKSRIVQKINSEISPFLESDPLNVRVHFFENLIQFRRKSIIKYKMGKK